MTQEQIEKAARESSTRSGYNIKIAADVAGRTVYECAFEAGAQWRINSVWHSGNEVPKKHKDLLIELKNMEFHICQFKDGDSFLGYYDDREFIAFEIISWAYVEDLLPTEGK